MYCNNCGEKGHYSRQCNKPITSYGVLLFTYAKDIPKIIMIQRKDSLCYIELIRGKYNPKNTRELILYWAFENPTGPSTSRCIARISKCGCTCT